MSNLFPPFSTRVACDNQKGRQTLPNDPWGTEMPLVANHWYRAKAPGKGCCSNQIKGSLLLFLGWQVALKWLALHMQYEVFLTEVFLTKFLVLPNTKGRNIRKLSTDTKQLSFTWHWVLNYSRRGLASASITNLVSKHFSLLDWA